MSTGQEQQHLAGPKASYRVGSHMVAPASCAPGSGCPMHIPDLRRLSSSHMATSPQHTRATQTPASILYRHVCSKGDFLLCQSIIAQC